MGGVRTFSPCRRGTAALFLAIAASGCRNHTPPPEASAKKHGVSVSQREAALASARVWIGSKVPIGKADLGVNPPGADGFAATADVTCTFTPKTAGGATPKFYCTLWGGDTIKVKYGEPNGEIPSEIASTRLLAALGFPTDRMYRVHSVRCTGCPPLPQVALQCLKKGGPEAVCLQGAAADRVVTFEHVAIERPFEGRKIEAEDDQGWSFHELDKLDPCAGGSSAAHVDALRLVAMLLAHWDNKGPNQRLVCPPASERADGSCAAPLAMLQDLGASFGPKRMDLLNWRQLPVWVDASSCQVSMKMLPFDGATFPDRQISEEGRQFALTLLRQLTRPQLTTLFDASGVTSFPHVLSEARRPEPWVDAFLDKLAQIDAAGPCPRAAALHSPGA